MHNHCHSKILTVLHAVQIARNRNAIIVVEAFLKIAQETEGFNRKGVDNFCWQVVLNTCIVSQDPFGNYLMQKMVTLPSLSWDIKVGIMLKLAEEVVHLSQQKYSSNFVECCLGLPTFALNGTVYLLLNDLQMKIHEKLFADHDKVCQLQRVFFRLSFLSLSFYSLLRISRSQSLSNVSDFICVCISFCILTHKNLSQFCFLSIPHLYTILFKVADLLSDSFGNYVVQKTIIFAKNRLSSLRGMVRSSSRLHVRIFQLSNIDVMEAGGKLLRTFLCNKSMPGKVFVATILINTLAEELRQMVYSVRNSLYKIESLGMSFGDNSMQRSTTAKDNWFKLLNEAECESEACGRSF